MGVKDYYLEHFDELPLDKQKHFATRIKYWFRDARFDDFLAAHEPSRDLAAVLVDNDYSGVNNFTARQSYFEKYVGLYGLEATLFRINRLLIEHDVDLREEFLRIYPREKLERLCAKLLNDTDALVTLSTYAANVICLCDNLFFDDNSSAQLAKKMLAQATQGVDFIYLYTHIILCMSHFYVRELTCEELELSRQMLTKCAEIIEREYDDISLDMKLEFLVCCRMTKYQAAVETKISNECDAVLADFPFVTDARKSEKYNTLAGAEHRNVLYIMAFES